MLFGLLLLVGLATGVLIVIPESATWILIVFGAVLPIAGGIAVLFCD